jgi:hypothetical protein
VAVVLTFLRLFIFAGAISNKWHTFGTLRTLLDPPSVFFSSLPI